MKTLIAAALAVLLAWPSLAAPWSRLTFEDHIAQTNVLLNDGCSGTVIDAEAGLILSAYHCFKADREHQKISITVYRGPDVMHQIISTAQVVAADAANDLLLLKTDLRFPFDMEATLSDGDVLIGDEVYLVGNPLGTFDNTVSKGVLGSKHERGRNDAHVWVVDARAMGGNSGGAAYSGGKLIGVLVAGMQRNQTPLGINFIVPLPTVLAFLDGYHAQRGVHT